MVKIEKEKENLQEPPLSYALRIRKGQETLV